MKVNVGIDLGTTYSAVSYFDNSTGEVKVLKNRYNEDFTPSVIYISKKEVIIGNEAKDLQSSGDVNTAAFYKTFMGDKNFQMYLDGKNYSSEDLSSYYLKELKTEIEKKNNLTIDGVVITVPAYFNEAQRQATINAGKKAGMNVLKIINEPTAAIIAYGLNSGSEKKIMVYDLGGGTFDVTVAEIVNNSVIVRGTNGDHQLGGKDWDAVIMNYLIEEFQNEFGINIMDYPEDYRELQVECEQIKKKLTALQTVVASVRCEGYVGRYEVTREWFDEQTEDLLLRTKLLIEECFEELGNGYTWNTMDEVVLVGGSTRMPQVREMITNILGKAPITSVNVDTVVSQGAAIQAALCKAQTIQLALGKTNDPATNHSVKRTLTLSSSSIQDVTSHSLGLLSISEDQSRYINTIIIPKNCKIPSVESRPFKIMTRRKDNFIDAYILQGESECPSDNHVLGKYVIEEIEYEPSGEAIVNISYAYDSNGMVNVTAIQKHTGKELKVTKNDVPSDLTWMDEKPEIKRTILSSTIYLVIDVSGSMAKSVNEVINAAYTFCDDLDFTAAKVGIIAFGDRVNTNCVPTNDRKKINKEINCIGEYVIKGKFGFGTGGQPLTYLLGAFNELNDKNYIVVLTDGFWGKASSEAISAGKLKQKGIEIVAIGIGEADSKFLGKIASSSEAALKTDLCNLNESFSSIAQSITEGKNSISLK